jgi:hypothetical protein
VALANSPRRIAIPAGAVLFLSVEFDD